MKNSKRQLTKNLQYLLNLEKHSLTTIARKAGVNKSTLHSYVQGVVPKSVITIESLAAFFSVPPEELLYRDLQSGKAWTNLPPEQKFEVTVRRLDFEGADIEADED